MAIDNEIITPIGSTPVTWWLPNSTSQWTNVWVSEPFKALATASTPNWLRDHVIPALASSPLGWFDPPHNARFYFAAWLMNAIMRRTYTNPLIQDLYVLHEALHAITIDQHMRHAPTPALALRANEIQVSLETECWIYERHPDWKGQTFDDLWIEHWHQLPQHAMSLASERQLHAVGHAIPWLIPRPPEQQERMWWARRHATHHPQTSACQNIRRYEGMATRWIPRMATIAPQVNAARLLLKHPDDMHENVQRYAQLLSRHVREHALPWGEV